MYFKICSLLLASSIPHLCFAQFPSQPQGVSIIHSRVDQRTQICEKTPGVKAYSGFVHLPGDLLQDVGGYDINSYFLFFEARHNASTAPLAIYLAGGPGESSTYAALSSENGPCYVNVNATDTIRNQWSFNNHVNMLYIDQPVQSGYSYDALVNATFDLLKSGLIVPLDANTPLPTSNASFGYGIYPSQKFNKTTNNTVQASRALWHFGEHWLSSFPGYGTKSPKISFWGNSYGGYWVPETAALFSRKLLELPTSHPLASKGLRVDTIGITNGCVDIDSGITGYPDFAYNNTYGVRFGSEAVYQEVMLNVTKPNGCKDLVQQCRALGQVGDPLNTGANATVNEACEGAFGYCAYYVIAGFPELFFARDNFDIAISQPVPCDFYLPVMQYLNKGSVQSALGVPLNFTFDSNVVAANFGLPSPFQDMPQVLSTGDSARINGLPNIEYLLANNVKVAFIFGDRDYRCPWTGGEATALAAKWKHQTGLAAAGYQEMEGIKTPADQGGHKALVKQYERFSFSRVLDSGHSVSAYAPETVYRIFERTIRGKDVVSGKKDACDGYHTTGPKSSLGWRNTLPAKEPTTCMVEGRFQPVNPWTAV